MKLKDNILMCADNRNSVHLYKLISDNKEVVYLGGEDTGRFILDCGWLNDDHYYNIDNQNKLNIFTTKTINY